MGKGQIRWDPSEEGRACMIMAALIQAFTEVLSDVYTKEPVQIPTDPSPAMLTLAILLIQNLSSLRKK